VSVPPLLLWLCCILQPLFVRLDTSAAFEFRIRNLSWPAETYQLSIDDATQEIVLRTTNKKYYKRWSIPDIKAAAPEDAKLDAKHLTHKHANNTLIISVSALRTWVFVRVEPRAERR